MNLITHITRRQPFKENTCGTHECSPQQSSGIYPGTLPIPIATYKDLLAIGNNHLELIMAGVGDDPTVSVAREVVDRIVRHIHVSIEGSTVEPLLTVTPQQRPSAI